MTGDDGTIRVNRAPVLTLWAAIVAERFGHDEGAAITLGRAAAGASARVKARSIRLEDRRDDTAKPVVPHGTSRTVRLLGRKVPVVERQGSDYAVDHDKAATPQAARAYVAKVFGEHLPAVRRAMEMLADSLSPAELNHTGFRLYEGCRRAPRGRVLKACWTSHASSTPRHDRARDARDPVHHQAATRRVTIGRDPNASTVVETTRPDAVDNAFFGHPRALGILACTEGWIGFSFYGMQSLLVLYMTGRLLQLCDVEHVLGFGAFRTALGAVYGPLGVEALAAAIMGLYAAAIYATPVLGGLLADRLLGRTRTVVLGAVLMTAGHFLVTFEACFLLALACLIAGMGCAGSLKAQVGSLYGPGDIRRADAFQLYSLSGERRRHSGASGVRHAGRVL